MQHHIINTPQHHVCSLQSLRAHCDHEPSWVFRASVRGKKQPIFRKSSENPARRRSPGFIRPSLLPRRTQKSGSGGILVVAINKSVSIRRPRPNHQSEFCILHSDFCILTSPCAHNPTPTAKHRPEALIRQCMAARAPRPVDDHRAASAQDDVRRMKVAVTDAFARGQPRKVPMRHILFGGREVGRAINPTLDLFPLRRQLRRSVKVVETGM